MQLRACLLAMALAGAAVAAEATELRTINPTAFYPEGPLWFNGRLYYVEYSTSSVLTWDGQESRAIWKRDGCGPASLVGTPEGNLLISCHDANTLVQISPSGETQNTIPTDSNGERFPGPHDFARDAKGGTYFSASGAFDAKATIRGRIYYLAPDGSLKPVAYLIHFPNGLALADDGKALLVSEHLAGRVLKFDVKPDGSLGNRKVFRRLQDIAPDPPDADAYTGPDGLKVDSKGNVYICQFGGGRVLVTDREGTLIRMLEVPARYVTNISFGATEDIVYITAVTDLRAAPYPGEIYEAVNR